MPINASGFFQRLFNWRNDRDAGIRILAERMDQEMDGIADGLNRVIQGQVDFKGPLTGVYGTAAAPAYSFAGDPDTGMYRISGDVLGFSAGGQMKVRVSASEVTFKEPLTGVYGTAAAPAYSFAEDPDTGMYRVSGDVLGFSAGGQMKVRVSTSEVTFDGHAMWHAGNDGAGSGLDADRLDNLHAASFLRADTGSTYTGLLAGARDSDEQLRLGQNVGRNPFISFFNQTTRTAYIQGRIDRLRLAADTSSDKRLDLMMDGTLLWDGKTVWHAGNDGAGSGLDADRLDGIEASDFLQKSDIETIPAGVYAPFAYSSSVPDGWLVANGSTISRSLYANLFAAIGTMYGSGNGSTTFKIPDLRGEFLRGLDSGRGVDPSSWRSVGSFQGYDIQSHTHPAHPSDATSNDSPGYFVTYNTNNAGWSRATGAYGGAETRPRNIAVVWCIKY